MLLLVFWAADKVTAARRALEGEAGATWTYIVGDRKGTGKEGSASGLELGFWLWLSTSFIKNRINKKNSTSSLSVTPQGECSSLQPPPSPSAELAPLCPYLSCTGGPKTRHGIWMQGNKRWVKGDNFFPQHVLHSRLSSWNVTERPHCSIPLAHLLLPEQQLCPQPSTQNPAAPTNAMWKPLETLIYHFKMEIREAFWIFK